MDYPPARATVETLPNGLTLILDPDPAAPVVSTQLWVETGSIHEDQHLGSGVSHFLEHMVFKGTRDFTGEELADAVPAAGGHWNAYTTFDRTVYFIDGPSPSMGLFLKCLTGLVFFPTLPEDEFEKEKDVIRHEIDMGLDDPDNVATRLALATIYQLDPRRHPVIGNRHRFDLLSHSDLLDYQRRRYTTDRSFVVISGDFDPEQARAEVLSLTKECAPGCGREPHTAAEPPQIGPRCAREVFAVAASKISLAWRIPALDHPDAPVFDVLAAVLGRGRSSRLYRTLREETGLALEISSYSWTGPARDGLFVIGAETPPEKRETLINAVHDQIAEMQTADLETDLAKAIRQIAVSQFRSLTSASGRASDLASNWHEARDLDFTRNHLAAIQAVTADDLRRVCTLLRADRMTLTYLDPPDAPAPQGARSSRRKDEEIRVHELDNGLRIALLPDHRVPLIQIQAAVRGGLVSETAENHGISQLLASCMPKGTATMSAAEIAIALESLGASCAAGTGNNALLVQASGLATDLHAVFALFSEILSSPALADDTVAREKASQLAALEEAAQDPLHLAFKTLRDAVFSGAGYGLDALGSIESLTKIGRSGLVGHHARHVAASNMTIAVSGDFDPDALIDRISENLGHLPAGEIWQAPTSTLASGADIVRHLPKKQAVLAIGFPGAAVSSADRHALALIQEYAADMAGPLFTRMREELGLAYQVGATQFLGYDTGMFTFYIATSPEQAELARVELLAQIRKIADAGIPENTLDRVKSTVLSGLAIQRQSPSHIARTAALDLLFGHPADQFLKMPEIYRNLSVSAIRQTASRVFSAAPCIATVMPEAE